MQYSEVGFVFAGGCTRARSGVLENFSYFNSASPASGSFIWYTNLAGGALRIFHVMNSERGRETSDARVPFLCHTHILWRLYMSSTNVFWSE